MKRTRHSRRRGAEGFSIIEVVIAMGILGFGLLTLALLQVHALVQGSAGRHTATASSIARSYLEQAHRVPWSVLTADANSGWQDPGWLGASATVNTQLANPSGGTTNERTYTVQWQVTDVGGTACLRDVDIRVSWNEEKRTTPKQHVLSTRRYDWGGAAC